jgi:hypothetical protein
MLFLLVLGVYRTDDSTDEPVTPAPCEVVSVALGCLLSLPEPIRNDRTTFVFLPVRRYNRDVHFLVTIPVEQYFKWNIL